MRNSITLSIATVLLLSAPAAFAAPLLRPMQSLKLPPPMETSSSSSVTVTESASSASSAKPKLPKPLKPLPLPGGMMGYCMQIKAALEKGQSITPSAANADKFNLSIDFLTKANALCEAMKAEQSSSSPWTPNSQSSSGYKGFKQPNYNECKVIGPDKTMAGIKYCKIQCGLTIKSDLCSKY